jgi:hypothetical protein
MCSATALLAEYDHRSAVTLPSTRSASSASGPFVFFP